MYYRGIGKIDVMGKRKSKKNKEIVQYESSNLSQEKMIEIQAEAYYRVIKRIESEKEIKSEKEIENKHTEARKYKWYENILFVINALLWPWKIHKNFQLKDNIYDNVLVVFISIIMQILGAVLWLFGIIIILSNFFINNNDIITTVSFAIFSLTFGSMFILAGGQFSEEKDSNRIYAYSSCMLALVGCIIAIVAIILT